MKTRSSTYLCIAKSILLFQKTGLFTNPYKKTPRCFQQINCKRSKFKNFFIYFLLRVHIKNSFTIRCKQIGRADCWARLATMLHHVAPCCTMLRHVGCCWIKFDHLLPRPCNTKLEELEPTTPNMSQHGATWCPSARNMLRPTMLRWYIAIVWAENVTFVWPPCCALLRHVVCCWLNSRVQKWCKLP